MNDFKIRKSVDDILIRKSYRSEEGSRELADLLLQIEKPHLSCIVDGERIDSPYRDIARCEDIFKYHSSLIDALPHLIERMRSNSFGVDVGFTENFNEVKYLNCLSLMCSNKSFQKIFCEFNHKDLLLDCMRSGYKNIPMGDVTYGLLNHFSGSCKMEFVNDWLDSVKASLGVENGPWFTNFNSSTYRLNRSILDDIVHYGRDIHRLEKINAGFIDAVVFSLQFKNQWPGQTHMSPLAYFFSKNDIESMAMMLLAGADPYQVHMYEGSNQDRGIDFFEVMDLHSGFQKFTEIREKTPAMISSLKNKSIVDDWLSEMGSPSISKGLQL